MKVLPFIAALLVLACSTSQESKIELVNIEDPNIRLWLNQKVTHLEEIWGAADNVEAVSSGNQYTYLIADFTKSVQELSQKNLDSGPKVGGVDADLLASVGALMRSSCTAVFIADPGGVIVTAQLKRFAGAQGCDPSSILSPNIEVSRG